VRFAAQLLLPWSPAASPRSSPGGRQRIAGRRGGAAADPGDDRGAGLFSTDWAGSSARWSDRMTEYAFVREA
jgi:hypothetical protein